MALDKLMRISYIFYMVFILLLLLISAFWVFLFWYLFYLYIYLFLNIFLFILSSLCFIAKCGRSTARMCDLSVSFWSCERRDSSSATFDICLRTEVDWSCASCCCLLRCYLALASFVCVRVCGSILRVGAFVSARSARHAHRRTVALTNTHTHIESRRGEVRRGKSLAAYTLLSIALGQSIRADYRNFIYINLASTCCAN